jgi:hypothetical protein
MFPKKVRAHNNVRNNVSNSHTNSHLGLFTALTAVRIAGISSKEISEITFAPEIGLFGN